MSKPLLVTIVKPTKKKAELAGQLFGSLVLAPLVAGFALMLLVPLAHEVLGTPDLQPGYWPSVAVVALTMWTIGPFRRSGR
jgi:uncharacterized membrane-anchored protein